MNTTMNDRAQADLRDGLKAALLTTLAVADTVKELGTVAKGRLYAATMGHFKDMAAFDRCVGVLVQTGAVEERGHLLTWKAGAE